VALPPGRLKGRARGLGIPVLLGVLFVGGVVEVSGGRHQE